MRQKGRGGRSALEGIVKPFLSQVDLWSNGHPLDLTSARWFHHSCVVGAEEKHIAINLYTNLKVTENSLDNSPANEYLGKLELHFTDATHKLPASPPYLSSCLPLLPHVFRFLGSWLSPCLFLSLASLCRSRPQVLSPSTAVEGLLTLCRKPLWLLPPLSRLLGILCHMYSSHSQHMLRAANGWILNPNSGWHSTECSGPVKVVESSLYVFRRYTTGRVCVYKEHSNI